MPGQKRLFYSSSAQAYCTFTPSHVKRHISVFFYSFAAQSRDQQTKLPEGPTYLCSLRKHTHCSSLQGQESACVVHLARGSS